RSSSVWPPTAPRSTGWRSRPTARSWARRPTTGRSDSGAPSRDGPRASGEQESQPDFPVRLGSAGLQLPTTPTPAERGPRGKETPVISTIVRCSSQALPELLNPDPIEPYTDSPIPDSQRAGASPDRTGERLSAERPAGNHRSAARGRFRAPRRDADLVCEG